MKLEIRAARNLIARKQSSKYFGCVLGGEANFDYFLMALTIKSRTTAPTVAITNWPINP
jgi:hypothetical protein